MKWFKLFLAVLLLPSCGAMSMSAWRVAQALTFGPQAIATPLGLAFCAGYAVWLIAFALLPKPMRTYVLGHELTHAFWALLMGARVSGLQVRKTGGQVKTSKTNWVIVLAPYFFPFYAMLFMGIFFLGHAIWNFERHFAVLFFLIGLGWSFHVTFTLMMLLSTPQPDVKSQGWFFSAVAIYLMNLVTLVVTATLLARSLTFGEVAQSFARDALAAYGWTLDKSVLL